MTNDERLAFAKAQRKKYPKLIRPFIHPSVKIESWVKIGKNVTIHEGCTIGTEGFGFVKERGKWLHIPHVGGVVIGDDVEIFPHSNVDRGTVNDTVIGKGTKIDHYCHIGHNSKVGENCVITAHVIIGGSAVIGDDVWIGPNSTVLNKVTVGSNVYIGSQTNVIKSVPDNKVVVGNPARFINRKK
ncbi:MAG: UDP-3-O-(3-hydroxymyristoyl)glucosamine N-acyltransferase [Methanobacteriota archaeon]